MAEKIAQHRMIHRVCLYIAGLFILAFGVALSINSDLGVSPVSSLPYVTSLIFETSAGMWVTAMFVFFLFIQIAIMRKEFRLIDVAQIPFSFVFGVFLDFIRWMLGDFQIPTYFGRLTMLGGSIAFIALGIVFIISAKLVALPAEALALVISYKIKGSKFHNVKVAVDSVLVLGALGASLLFLGGMYGVREGTVISAVAIGKAMPPLRKLFLPVFRRIYKDDALFEEL